MDRGLIESDSGGVWLSYVEATGAFPEMTEVSVDSYGAVQIVTIAPGYVKIIFCEITNR